MENYAEIASMELFVTKNSPYARLVRVLIHELDIQNRVKVTLAKTRTKNSPYYAINPSGRVPYLICDDGTGLEDSELICDYLCALHGSELWTFPGGNDAWEMRRLHGLCRSFLDGLSVWLREIHRPSDEQSPSVIVHEQARAARYSEVWEAEMTSPFMQGSLNRTQITLCCTLEIERSLSDFDWRYERMASRPSLKSTLN
jgi:glutathione S-transferase